jgi:hypothetical protein
MRVARLSALVSIAAVLAAPAARAYEIVALTSTGNLLRFDRGAPDQAAPITVTGVDPALPLVSIDVHPGTGALYGLGVNGTTVGLYTIDPVTGAATAAGTPAPLPGIAGAAHYEMDFISAFDSVRVVSSLASDGAGANVNHFFVSPSFAPTALPDLDFSPLPGGAAEAPLAGIADPANLDGSLPSPFLDPPYAILAGSDRLGFLQSAMPPFDNNFFLVSSGFPAAGPDLSGCTGFDMIGAAAQFYAVCQVGGVWQLYGFALPNGDATLVGPVGDGTVALAGMTILHPEPTVRFSSATYDAPEQNALAQATIECVDCDFEGASVSYRTLNGTARAGLDYLPDAETFLFLPGETEHDVNLYVVDDYTPRGSRSFSIEIDSTDPIAALATPSTTVITILDDDGISLPVAQMMVKPTSQAKLTAKGTFALPDAPSEDPTTEGGTLTLTGASGYVTYDLPAAGWQNVGGNGVRFKDASCKVSVNAKQINAACKGATGTLALPEAGPVSAVLSLGDLRYCGECGGTASGNPAKAYKRKACAAPVSCPALP